MTGFVVGLVYGIAVAPLVILTARGVVSRWRRREPGMRHEVNEVKYERGMERYVFRFDGRPDSLLAAYQAIGDTARDPDLEFNWQDAALVERMVRELVTHKREGGG